MLESVGLRDVRNLRLFATSLVKLTLNQNNIVDIGQFLEFPNLRELYLQENHMYVASIVCFWFKPDATLLFTAAKYPLRLP